MVARWYWDQRDKRLVSTNLESGVITWFIGLDIEERRHHYFF
jgi:hypothetical protein